MQQNDARNDKNDQKQQLEQNQLEVVKKKPSLLKKKKMPPTKLFSNIDLKHVINVGDVCFVNEDSLRFPQSSDETLLKALYSYKMISKVNLNNSFINIELKKNNDNLFPAEYFVERLRSFGDQQLTRIANHLEKINRQFVLLKQSCPVQQKSFVKDKQESLLQNFLEKMEGKKYFVYFSQITPQKINMKNIVFSIPLLKALGCNLKNIAIDFLKYKHVFFEVFTTKMYKFFIDQCLQNFGKLQAELMVRPDMSDEEKEEITSFCYDDEVIRIKQGPNGIYEEISHAKVRWFSPHTSICCFEILDIDEAEGIKIPKLRKINHFEETKPEEELKELRQIGINFPLLQIQDDNSKNNQLTIEKDHSQQINKRNEVNEMSIIKQI